MGIKDSYIDTAQQEPLQPKGKMTEIEKKGQHYYYSANTNRIAEILAINRIDNPPHNNTLLLKNLVHKVKSRESFL